MKKLKSKNVWMREEKKILIVELNTLGGNVHSVVAFFENENDAIITQYKGSLKEAETVYYIIGA